MVCHGSKPAAGFTLLELLVAMVIMAMIMTTAIGSIRAGNRSWQAGLDRADDVEEVRAVAEFLRRQLGQTVPLTWEDDTHKIRLAFAGDNQRLQFIAPAPQSLGGAGLLVYTLLIENRLDRSKLRLSFRLYDPSSNEFTYSPADPHTTLVTNAGPATFEYFGAPAVDRTRDWQPEWPADAEYYPQLVRFRAEAVEGSTGWPVLVLPIRARLTP